MTERREGQHKVTLTFYLDEEVTKRIFAEKVARACMNDGALRIGEGVGTGRFTQDGPELVWWVRD